jgi:hypothetical protein
MFDDAFVDKLPEEVLPAAQKIKAKFDASDEAISQKEHSVEAYYNAYLKAYGLLQAFSSAKELDITFPELTESKMDSILIIRQAFFDLGREITKLEKNKAHSLLESTKFHFSTKFGGIFAYEFSKGDLTKIEAMIDGIGKFVAGSEEAGIARANLGRDAKPVVDRVRKIVEIVWRTQARAEELPSGLEIPSVWKNSV